MIIFNLKKSIVFSSPHSYGITYYSEDLPIFAKNFAGIKLTCQSTFLYWLIISDRLFLILISLCMCTGSLSSNYLSLFVKNMSFVVLVTVIDVMKSLRLFGGIWLICIALSGFIIVYLGFINTSNICHK